MTDEAAPKSFPIDPPAPELNVNGPDFAALVAARLCHDFISPASAIVSGLDLLEDPSAQDMREDAMSLIASSARKLADLLQFTRVAFGASASAENSTAASWKSWPRACSPMSARPWTGPFRPAP